MGDWIDIHSHIIPGVDDGCRDMDMAIRMLRIAQDNGIVTVFFAWVKNILDNKSISSTNFKAALNYSVNQ